MPSGIYLRKKPIWINGIRVPKEALPSPRLCECGCRELAGAGKRFIRGHNILGTHPHIGQLAWNKGLTKEVDERVKLNAERTSFSLKGKHFPHSFSKGCTPWIKGLTKNTNEKVRLMAEKLSQDRKGKTPKNIMDNCFFFNTKPEKEMKKVLDELKVEYEFQFPVWNIKHCYVADFYLPLYNTIIEVDGKWFHNYPDGREIDHVRTQELKSVGYGVLRFWENEFDLSKVQGSLLW